MQRMHDVGWMKNEAGMAQDFQSLLWDKGQGAKQGQRDIHMRTAELEDRAAAQETSLFQDWLILNERTEFTFKNTG